MTLPLAVGESTVVGLAVGTQEVVALALGTQSIWPTLDPDPGISVLSPARIIPEQGVKGTRFKVDPGTYSGADSVSTSLMFDGVDVTDDISGGLWEAPNSGELSMVVSAESTTGSTNYSESASALTSGRTSTTPLKVFGVDTLPTGMTYASSTGRVNVTATFNGVIDGWDFTGKYLTVYAAATISAIRQCVFTISQSASAMIDIFATATLGVIENNDFFGSESLDGTKTAISVRSDATNATTTASGGNYKIRRNLFEGFTTDAVIINGAQVEHNRFIYTRNVASIPADWSSSVTYAIGNDVIQASTGRIFRSKINGNLNQALPASETSNTAWQTMSPHLDCITFAAAIGSAPSIIGNVFDVRGDGPGLLRGINNSIRVIVNAGASPVYKQVLIEGNTLLRPPGHDSFPIEVNLSGSGFDQPWVRENTITPGGAGSAYVYPISSGGNMVWGENWDALTGVLIPQPANTIAE